MLKIITRTRLSTNISDIVNIKLIQLRQYGTQLNKYDDKVY